MEPSRFFMRFAAWTLASFVCHKSGKLFLNGAKQVVCTSATLLSFPCMDLVPALGLTAVQILTCLLLASFDWRNSRSVRLVMVSHFLATVTTNTSMASLHTASTFTIKLSEPVMAAIACRLRAQSAVPSKSILGLSLIVIGALLFVGNPFIGTGTAITGISMAFISSAFTSIRNLTLKDVHSAQNQFMNVRKLKFLPKAAIVIVVIALSYLCLTSGAHAQIDEGAAGRLVTCYYGLISGVFHAVYTYMSTMVVLKVVDSFDHSIAGVCKRMATVILLYVFGQRQASRISFIGLSITALGLLLHVSSHKGKRFFLVGFTCIATMTCLGLCINGRDTNLAKLPPLVVTGPRALFKSRPPAKFPSLALSPSRKPFQDRTLVLDKRSRDHQDNLNEYASPVSEDTRKSFHNLNMTNSEHTYFKSGSVPVPNNSNKNNDIHAVEQRTFRKLSVKPFIYSPLPVAERKRFDADFENDEFIFNNTMKIKEVRQDGTNKDEEAYRQMAEFLKYRLIDSPFETNRLSRLLRSSRGIVEEAGRVLETLLRDLIGQARYAMLMEVANIENKGDPAIAVGELKMLKRLNMSIIFHCSSSTCTDRNLDNAVKLTSPYRHTDLVVFMQGGGNLVLYKQSDDIREKVIRRFSQYKMILLSQSIWFMPKIHTRLKRCQGLYSHQPNLTIFLRDEQSLRMAQTYFPGTSLFLAPDLAFAIGSLPRIYPPSFDIVWLRRQDRESSKYSLPSWNSSLSVYVDDWVNWKTPKGVNDLDTTVLMAHSGLTFLQRGRVVITDRLHGHILSVLLDIPHVLIDNPPAKKLSSYHRTWTLAASRVALVTDPEKALTEAVHLLERYSSILPTKLPFINGRD